MDCRIQTQTEHQPLSKFPACCLPYLWILDLPASINSVQFSHSVMSDSLWPHGLQHTRLPCPSPTPGACSNSCPLSQRCHPTISSSVIPFSSCLQSFLASVQFSSVAQVVSDYCNPMNRSMPGLPVHHHLPEFGTSCLVKPKQGSFPTLLQNDFIWKSKCH